MISEEKKKIVIENYFKSECNINTTIHDAYVKGFERGLSKAPQPEPKTGRWILADNQDDEDVANGNYRYICSECGKSDVHAKTQEVPFCWHCGTKMEEEHE